MTRRYCFFLQTLASIAIAGVAQAQPQTPPSARPQRPAFKSGVDLVTLDVSVVDRDGRPVPDLKPWEIVVTVDGAPRPIASAEFISTVGPAATLSAAPPRRDYSTNEPTVPGRLIAMVVDLGNIRRGGERSVLRAAGRFIDRLTPADRVALITIPGPGPTVGFTADRTRLKDAFDRVAGQYETREGLHNIAATEALAIEDGDAEALGIVIERECSATDQTCPQQIEIEARQGAAQARRRSDATLRSFIELLGKMTSIDGPKTLVFLSEGLVIDSPRTLTGLPPEIASLAAQAQVTVYVLRIDIPYFDATENKPVHQIDFAAERQGLESIAGVTRGSMFTVVGTGTSVFDRVAREIAGYYLVGFEAQGRDRDGQRHQIKVTVRRPRVQVRARREFQAPAAAPDTERPSASAAILSALKAPLPLSGMPMRVASYILLDPDRSKVRISVAAEIGESFAAPAELGLGYVLSDREGTVIAGQTKRVTLRLSGSGPGALEYRDEFSVAPGDYTFKLAVTDAAGHLGSVDHAVHAAFARIGSIAAADLVVNDDRDAQQRGTQMRVRPLVVSGRLQCALDMKTLDAGSPADVRVTFEIADAAGRTMKTSAATVISSSDGARHVARGAIDTAGLPPGDYVAHAAVAIAGQKKGDVSRQFRIQ